MPATPTIAGDTGPGHVPTRHPAFRGSPQPTPQSRVPGRRPEGKAVPGTDGRRRRPALGNNAKTAAAAGQSTDPESRRTSRYRARSWLSTVTALPRVSKCGRVSVIEGGEVALKVSQGPDGKLTAGFGGLSTCGSVWACPVCSAKIAARRTQEIEHLLAWNASRGGSVALATFTMRHHTGHRLKALRKALSAAWRHLTASRTWKETRKAEGCDGYVRAIECTYGENGWHLHIHVLLIFDGPITSEWVAEWTDELYQLWSDGLAKSNMEASRKHGVDVRLGTGALDGLGKYLSKLTYETAGGRFKTGQKDASTGKASRTPFELLDDAINTGNADDFDAWFEWENASKGMRQITWSRGLKAKVELDDVDDETIAEEDQDGDTLLMITPSSWHEVYWHAAELLTTTEQGGSPAALSWLDSRGYTYQTSAMYETLAE